MSWLDLNDVAGKKTFEALPEGEYKLGVEDATLRTTKSGDGQYVSVQMVVMDGEHEGRKVFTNFNIKNASERATEIGLSRMKQMLECAGKTDFVLESPADLVGLTVGAWITRKETEQWGVQNDVAWFKSVTQSDVL